MAGGGCYSQYRRQHDTAGEDAKRQLRPNEAKSRVAREGALPEDEQDPAEAADDENGNGGGAVPGVVADGSLVDDEDGQDGGGQDEDGAEVVEPADTDWHNELVVLGPEEEEQNSGDKGARRTVEIALVYTLMIAFCIYATYRRR